jgi:hypothetical protein
MKTVDYEIVRSETHTVRVVFDDDIDSSSETAKKLVGEMFEFGEVQMIGNIAQIESCNVIKEVKLDQ